MSENEKIMKLLEEIRDRLPAAVLRPAPLPAPWYPNYPYPYYPTPWWGTYPGSITYGSDGTTILATTGTTYIPT